MLRQLVGAWCGLLEQGGKVQQKKLLSIHTRPRMHSSKRQQRHMLLDAYMSALRLQVETKKSTPVLRP
jgi:hypothetical protein